MINLPTPTNWRNASPIMRENMELGEIKGLYYSTNSCWFIMCVFVVIIVLIIMAFYA
jgi:hypothetical protein